MHPRPAPSSLTPRATDLKGLVLKGAAGSFGLNLANTALTVIASVVLARALGVSDYGIFAYVVALGLLVTVPAVLGVDRLLIRDVSVYGSRGSWRLMAGLLRQATRMVLISSIVLALLVGCVAYLAIEEGRTETLPALLIGVLAIPLTALARVHQSALMGLHRIVASQLPELLVRPVLFLALVVVAALWLADGFDATAAVGLHVLSAAFALAAVVLLLRRWTPPSAKGAAREYDNRTWLRDSIQLAFLSGAAVVNAQTGTVLLGALRGPEEAGLYAVATRGALLIGFALTAVNTALAPAAARLWAEGQVDRLQAVVTSSARVVLAFSIPVTLIFVVFASPLLAFAFGEGFAGGGTALAILSLGQLVNAALGSVGTLLIMTGHQTQAAAGIAAGAALNVLLGLVLIPTMGTEGAAIAATASMIVWNVLLAVAAYRKVGVQSTALGRLRWPSRLSRPRRRDGT